MSIYRSREGKRVLERCYDLAVDDLDVDVDETSVETRYGSTHVLVAGPVDGEPVFVFHGGNATNPMTLAWYTDLADEYRLIAPDTVGHPGKSAETRLDPSGDEYGRWMVDVMDAFDVASAPMLGTSYGGGIILRAAAYAPERIDCAALVVPAGLGTGSPLSLAKVGLPSILYRYVPREPVLEFVISRLVTEPESDDLARSTIGASLRYVDLERELPSVSPGELESFTAPVALCLGGDDPFFPPAAISKRAQECFQSISFIASFQDEKHVLSSSARAKVSARLRDFFDDPSLVRTPLVDSGCTTSEGR